MSIATLGDIITKTRKLTSSGNSFQLTDAQIKDYINSFYLYDLPEQFRSLKLQDIYTFDTIMGIDTYPFDSESYYTVQQPCFCAKRQIAFFTDPASFYRFNTNYAWQIQDFFDIGDGGAGPYSGFTSAKPIVRSANNNPTNLNYPASRVQNILITVNTATGTLNVTDSPNGNNSIVGTLIGDCLAGGTINYQTGEIAGLTFTSIVPAGNQIQIQYCPVQLTIPIAIMFFQNQFTLRPVPDRGYTIELVAYRQPTQAMAATAANQGTPELKEWWELVAVGAAKKIYEDRLDTDGIQMMDKMLKERYSINMTRTYAQIGSAQRVPTIFADQLGQGAQTGGGGSLYGSI